MERICKEQAIVSLDGPEVCREYCRTEKLWFGTSELLPGQTGGIDAGHPFSQETFFCAKGHVLVRKTDDNSFFELREGDLLLIREGEPHEITNIGMEPALIAWCGGPTREK